MGKCKKIKWLGLWNKFSYLKIFQNISKYNWKKSERQINNFSNFITDIDGIKIHFIKEKEVENPTPLLLMYGWPGV